jgi:hypothetical protein
MKRPDDDQTPTPMYLDVENRQRPDELPPYELEPTRMARGINHHPSGSTFMDTGVDRISSSHTCAPLDEIPSSGDTDVTGKIKKYSVFPHFLTRTSGWAHRH